MSIFKIVWKNIKQRSLASVLTMFSIMLGVALVVSILILKQESQDAFNQTATGYEVIVGPKGSSLQLTLNTIYQIGVPIQNMPYDTYTKLKDDKRVKLAIPYVLGDNYKNHRLIGTVPEIFSDFTYQKNKKYSFKEGKPFTKDFEAVIGNETALKAGLKIGDTFTGSHGVESYEGSEGMFDHEEFKFTITGILEKTFTPIDKVIFTSMNSIWEIHHHEAEEKRREREGITRDTAKHDGHDHTKGEEHVHDLKDLDKSVTAILISLKSPVYFDLLRRQINENKYEGINAQAVIPVFEIKQLFDIIGNINSILIIIAYLVVFVAVISILVSIYNSMNERKRDIAIMRALGAKKQTILNIILMEGFLLSFIGGLLGLIVSHLLIIIFSDVISDLAGIQISGTVFNVFEFYILTGTVLLGLVVTIIPALKAYNTDVAGNLAPVS
jgi:putative ABC transport system permease protein